MTRPLRMSLNYEALIDHYEVLLRSGIALQENEVRHLEECKRMFALTSSKGASK